MESQIIRVNYAGRWYDFDRNKWMFQENRRAVQWLGLSGISEFGEALTTMRPDALGFLVWVVLHRAGEAPEGVTTREDFEGWYCDDAFDFDLVGFTEADTPAGQAEDDSHLPTTSDGRGPTT